MKKGLAFLFGFIVLAHIGMAQCPTTIIGPGTICTGPPQIVYYQIDPYVTGGTWFISGGVNGGGTVLPQGSGPTVAVKWNSPSTIPYQLNYVKSGCADVVKTVTYFGITTSGQGAITGPFGACPGIPNTYSVPPQSGFTIQAYVVSLNGFAVQAPIVSVNGYQVSVTVFTIGTYLLNVAYHNGTCSGLQMLQSFACTAGNQAVSISPTTACYGTPSTYTATGDYQDTFTWQLSGGGTVTPTGNPATVTWGPTYQPGPFTLTATGTNSCSPTPRSSPPISITVNPPGPTAGPITGPDTGCSTLYSFYSIPVGGASSYKWTATPAGFASFTDETASATAVRFNSAGTYTLSVQASNSTCYGTPASKIVTVTTGPTNNPISITSPSGLRACMNQNATFSVVSPVGSNTYNWSIIPSTNGSFVGPSNGTSVTVKLTTTTSPTNLVVHASLGTCNGPDSSTPIFVDTAPASISEIIGSTAVCKGNYNYYVQSNPKLGAVSWNVSGGASQPSPTGPFTATINWTTAGGPYTLTATGYNACGSSSPLNVPVTVANSTAIPTTGSISDQLPMPPYPPAPPNCLGFTKPWYTVFTPPTVMSFLWSAKGGTVQTSSIQGGVPPQLMGVAGISWQRTGIDTIWVTPVGGTCQGNPVSKVLVVSQPTTQTITFPSIPAKTYGDSPFTLFAGSSSGLPISYVSDNLSVATISGNTITIVGSGTSNITASQAGDPINCMLAATPVSMPLTVSKAVLNATASEAAKTYGSINPSFGVTYTGFKGSDNVGMIDSQPTTSTTATQFSNTGTYLITLSGGLDNNYTFLFQTGSLTINKANVTATADNKSKIYGSLNPAFSITYTGLLGSDTPASILAPPTAATTAVQYSNVGTYTITLTGGTATNYTITNTAGTLTVSKATLTATATNQSKTYGALNPALPFTYSGFLGTENSSVIDTQPTNSTAAAQFTSVGSYPITLSGGADNNYTIVLNAGTLTINKATLTVAANNQSRPYNTANPALTFTYSGFLGTDNSSVVDAPPLISTSATLISVVGNYPITFTGGTDNNYAITLVNGTLTIVKADQTISLSTIPGLCANASYTLVATSTSGLPVAFASSSPPTISISGTTAIAGSSNGNATIIASQSGNSNYNPANNVTQSVNVYSIPIITVAASPPSVCPGSSSTLTATGATTYTWTATSGPGLPSGSPITVQPSVATTYTVTGSSNGCIATPKNITVSIISSTGTITSCCGYNFCTSSHIQLDAGAGTNYYWTTPNGSHTTTSYYIATIAGSGLGNYTVTYMAATGCSVTATATLYTSGGNCAPRLIMVQQPTIKGIPAIKGKALVGPRQSRIEPEIQSDLENTPLIYPIPADKQLIVEIPGGSGASMKLVDLTGKIVNQEQFENDCTRKEIDVSNHSEGIYLLMITGPQGPVSRKVIIIHK